MAQVRFGALANSTVVVTAIVYGLLLTIAGAAGVLGLPLRVMLTVSMYRYGYAALRHIANGWNHFPPPDLESTNPFTDLSLVFHAALFGSLLFLFATTPLIDLPLRLLLLVVVAAAFPASAGIMAMTRNLAAALNPFGIASLIGELGVDYAKLLGVTLLLSTFVAYADGAPWYLGVFAEMAGVWATLALFLATGATLRAHRAELGLLEGLDDAEQRERREREAQWRKALDRAYAFVRSGLTAEAYRTIKELIHSEADSLEIHQWTFNAMLEWDEPRHAALFGERFAARLWDAGRKYDALELARRCLRLSPSFAPPAKFTAELAKYARELGRDGLADDLDALVAGRPAGRAALIDAPAPPSQRERSAASESPPRRRT